MSKGNTSAGRLARVPSCWATRTSEDRAEIAGPDPYRPGRQQWREEQLRQEPRGLPYLVGDDAGRTQSNRDDQHNEKGVRDAHRGNRGR